MAEFRLAEKITDEIAKTFSPYSPLVAQLLFTRGITSTNDAEKFLTPNYDTELHDPHLLHDIQKAIERIEIAIEKKEHIVIFSDYDCDGIPGGVVLHDFFKAISYEHFSNYIPHRHHEGFGLSVEAVEKLATERASLIITIDCGTTDVLAVETANRLGVDVIITDHHEPSPILPNAIAIVNPKLGSYPFTELCGAGVVFKLIQALLSSKEYGLVPGHEKWWLDMVGIATIADMVPLVGENRIFAHYGLKVLRKSRRPGLQKLLKKAKASQQHLSEDDVGFTIGPRINAASRMDTPEDAFFILSSTDEVEAGARVDHLEKLNQERKTSVAQMTKELHKRLKEFEEIPSVIALGNPNWRPALVGLAASKLAEEHNRPVFLWGRDGNGKHKGSCRSGGGMSVVRLMEESKGIFTEFGGHHMSGGFTIVDEAVFTFGDELQKSYSVLGSKLQVKEDILIDAELSLDDSLVRLLRDIKQLAPFGVGNPKPLFQFTAAVPDSVEQFGKTKEHVKLRFQTESGAIEAIAFFATPESFTKVPKANEPCSVIAHIEESFFMNRLQIRLRIIDIL